MKYLLACAAALGLGLSATAETINVPEDYALIQDAIDASSDGDVIIVSPGTYTDSGEEVVNMLGKQITLQASGTPEETIIDGEGERMVIRCNTGETAATKIVGFLITGGYSSSGYSGGIQCYQSSPTLTGCIISDNIAEYYGGGIWCGDSSPTITDCTISSNTALNTGGGIYCYFNSSPTITNCEIINNTATSGGGGIYCHAPSDNPTLTECTISGNTAYRGGGVFCDNESSPTLNDCTIVDNTANYKGGGVHCNASGSPTLTNCVISNNTAAYGGGISSFNYCDLTIIECTISSNTATSTLGGGTYHSGLSSITAIDTSICGNGSNQLYGNVCMQGQSHVDADCDYVCDADTQGDGSVDVLDLLATIESWGLGEAACSGDVNLDGEVDVIDLLAVINAWGSCS